VDAAGTPRVSPPLDVAQVSSLYCYPAKSFQADKIFLATKRHKSHKRNSFLSLLSLFVACIPWSRLGCGSAALCSLRFNCSVQDESSNVQAPRFKEAPNHKLQSLVVHPVFGVWCLGFIWRLAFGIWSFGCCPGWQIGVGTRDDV